MLSVIDETTKKICLFGDSGVGKTSLIVRYVQNKFDEKYIRTIGTNIYKKNVEVMNNFTKQPATFKLLIWDIMGQKGIRELLQEAYFDGASGAIGVCDCTDRDTLEDLDSWRKAITKVAGEIPMVFLANKCDLKEQMAMNKDDLKNILVKYVDVMGDSKLRKILLNGKEPCLFTSAKTGENVELAFKTLCEAML